MAKVANEILFFFMLSVLITFAVSIRCESAGHLMPEKMTTLSGQHSGESVAFFSGDTFAVILSKPAGGYQFIEPEFNTEIIVLLDTEQVGPDVGSNLDGGTGATKWTFKAMKHGTTTLSIKISRSWEQNILPLEFFTVKVGINQ